MTWTELARDSEACLIAFDARSDLRPQGDWEANNMLAMIWDSNLMYSMQIAAVLGWDMSQCVAVGNTLNVLPLKLTPSRYYACFSSACMLQRSGWALTREKSISNTARSLHLPFLSIFTIFTTYLQEQTLHNIHLTQKGNPTWT